MRSTTAGAHPPASPPSRRLVRMELRERHFMKKFTFPISCALCLVLAGCSQTPTKPAAKKAEEKPEPVTGMTALFKMYAVARQWAPDVQILKLGSINLADVPLVRGKAGAWQVTFVSPSKAKARGWTYSVIESEGNLHKGAFAGLEEAWAGPRGINTPFSIQAVKVDTDAAYKTALTKGAEYDKKNPGKPITFLLEQTKKHPDPVWRVVWGESVGTSNFSILVDASTGLYLETLR